MVLLAGLEEGAAGSSGEEVGVEEGKGEEVLDQGKLILLDGEEQGTEIFRAEAVWVKGAFGEQGSNGCKVSFLAGYEEQGTHLGHPFIKVGGKIDQSRKGSSLA
jgi:hypothetical protein